VLDKTGSLPVSFPVQIIIVSYRMELSSCRLLLQAAKCESTINFGINCSALNL